MKLLPFCILTALALIYAGLTIAESALYQTWDRALSDQKDIQTKVAFYQRLDGTINLLLRRMAVDSQRDPALLKLLNDHKIKVVIRNPEPMDSQPAPVSLPATTTNKPPQTPAAPTQTPP
jgi:hypothetical protein